MSEIQDFDVIIIGGGPGGVSASLYTVRAGMKTILLAKDGGALEKSDFIDNYYGFENGSTGKDLIKAGLAQAERVGATVVYDEVVHINYTDSFTVKSRNGLYKAPVVVMAVGASRPLPNIRGLREFEGRGVSYCAVCDGFFFKGKEVAVLGTGDFALHEAMDLVGLCSKVYLLTNAKPIKADFPSSISIYDGKISSIEGTKGVERVLFEDGTSLDISAIFVAAGVAGSTEFAQSLGIALDGRNIQTNEKMETNIPGLYAAGDCTGGMRQIAAAVYQGARAGSEAVKYIRNLRDSK